VKHVTWIVDRLVGRGVAVDVGGSFDAVAARFGGATEKYDRITVGEVFRGCGKA
jgi:hypothetical protein